MDKAEDDMQTFDVTISDLEKSIEDITREIVTITDEFAAQGSKNLKKMWPSRWTCRRRSISIRPGVMGVISLPTIWACTKMLLGQN